VAPPYCAAHPTPTRPGLGRSDYRDEWYGERCGGCLYRVPLTGVLGDDYGACTNDASPRDRVVQFEHDGCEAFEAVADAEWAGAGPTPTSVLDPSKRIPPAATKTVRPGRRLGSREAGYELVVPEMVRMGVRATVAAAQRPFGTSAKEVVTVDGSGMELSREVVPDAPGLMLQVVQFVDLDNGVRARRGSR
jgi:DUF3027 family protein